MSETVSIKKRKRNKETERVNYDEEKKNDLDETDNTIIIKKTSEFSNKITNKKNEKKLTDETREVTNGMFRMDTNLATAIDEKDGTLEDHNYEKSKKVKFFGPVNINI
jgi:hypothetical protein